MAGVRWPCKVLKLDSGDEFGGIISPGGGGGDFSSGVAGSDDHRSISKNGIEGNRDRISVVRFAAEPAAETGVIQAGSGIELIESEGRDETRLAGAHSLGAGAEASMVDDCGSGWKNFGVGGGRNREQVWRWRNVGGWAEEKASAAESNAGGSDGPIAIGGMEACG